MHDPFQTYATLGSYGIPTPIGLPYGGLQGAGINPALGGGIAQMGLAQQPYGLGQGFINPQQLQLAALASQGGLQHPLLAAALLSNPLIAASLHQGALGQYGQPQFGLQQHSPYQQIGQMGSPFGQIGSPFGQMGSPFGQMGSPFGQMGSPFAQLGGSPFGQPGYPLAPQSWIGKGGLFGGAQGFGQINPWLSQLGRPFQGQGLSPWGY
jgi:hypothetical protein